MSKLKSFTLIELLIVVVLIGLVSFLVIKPPPFTSSKSITDLRDILYPNGVFYKFEDSEIIEKNDKNISSSLAINNPTIYIYDGYEFVKKPMKLLQFKYRVKNGIGDSFILKCDEGVYVFKPFSITKVKDLYQAENLFLLKNYMPKEGEYY
jgi:hypothetical protein